MSVCIHGNLCREIYKKTGYIHSQTCPSNCKYFEEMSMEQRAQNTMKQLYDYYNKKVEDKIKGAR